MSVETIFAVSGPPPSLFVAPVICIGMVALGLGFAMYPGRARDAQTQKIFAFVLAGFAAVLGVVLSASAVVDYAHVASDYRAHRYQVVAGCLGRFTRSTSEGHTPDVITVAGRTLSYADNEETFGFHTTEISGGPIHADTWVRLFLVDDVIARLDVAQHACPRAAEAA
jgi:hypothetical protein